MADERKLDFASAVWKRHHDDIHNAVAEHIELNYKQLDLHTSWVKNPDEANLHQIYFQRLLPYDAPGDTVRFDVVISAEIEIYEQSHSQAKDGEVTKWFRVSCEAELNRGLHNFRITAIDEYNHHENDPRGMLTDSLVPYIRTDQLEHIAEAILKQYYPEALHKPVPINVWKFAENIGLTITQARLSKNETIFGAMIFNDCTVDFYDIAVRRFDTMEVNRKTILVDPEVYFLRALGSWNNTVVHECVHWIKHRNVFELEYLYNENVSMIRCQVVEKDTPDEKTRTDTEWMEWHANALAPRILMPYKPFKQKAAELIRQYKQEWGTDDTSDVISMVIEDLHDFFGVSIQAAKIRMIDVGYMEAIGVFEYVDDHYVPAHSFKDGAIEKGQTYSVPVVDSIVQYAFNPDLRRILDSGNFVYIDTHFCINDPKYVVENDFGILEMTEYANTHMDECCLTFERTTRPNADYGAQRYTECILFQKAVSKTVNDFQYSHTDNNSEVEARAAAIRAEHEEVKEIAKIVNQLPVPFNDSLVFLMKWKGITVERLAEKALVSAKTIQRMRNEQEHGWDLDLVIAVCIGLQLPPSLSNLLLEKTGHKLMVGEKGMTYSHLLATRYQGTIHEVNEYLETTGYSRLSDKE